MSQRQANPEQATYWNEIGGPRWVAMQEDLDAELAPFGVAVETALALRAGAHVLDVGCGAGATSLSLTERVRPGEVLGVDISAPLLARARQRAQGVAGLRFQLADAQTFAFEPERFDAVFSRFGVMFFADPVAAFSNLRVALRTTGKLGFVCWRSQDENPSFTLPARAAMPFLQERPESPKPGEPGPFAFAQREHLANVLERAGFCDVSIEPQDTHMVFAGRRDLEGAVEQAFEFGPLGRLRTPLEPHVRAQVWDAIRAAFEPHYGPSGVVLPAATWLVTARKG
ncbi:MAG: SAM-dependent methyltransferase PhcB [Polyangiaceae bacterium]|jgi:ubiquinone/menaquinone biosynthesis C-methylase UbiE|nr:SAM-dependent methyltransferase PhcB [Polyangiaceae bacterium]